VVGVVVGGGVGVVVGVVLEHLLILNHRFILKGNQLKLVK
jgi:hypothetical protein